MESAGPVVGGRGQGYVRRPPQAAEPKFSPKKGPDAAPQVTLRDNQPAHALLASLEGEARALRARFTVGTDSRNRDALQTPRAQTPGVVRRANPNAEPLPHGGRLKA